MSLSAVHGVLTSLKSCQADIGTGMDIVTDVAMDLAEAKGNVNVKHERYKKVSRSMLVTIAGFAG